MKKAGIVAAVLAAWLLAAGLARAASGQDFWIEGSRLMREGLPAEALPFFGKALAAPDLDRKTRVFVLNDRGEAFEKLGKLDKALEDFRQANKLAPRHLGAYLARARIWQKKGVFQKAKDNLDRAIKLNSGQYHLWMQRGLLWMKLGNAGKAAWDFEKAVQLRGDSRKAHFNLALAYEKMGRYWKAYDEAKTASRPNPGPEHNELLGRLYKKIMKEKAK